MSRTITAGGFGHVLANELVRAKEQGRLKLPVTAPEKIVQVEGAQTPQVFVSHEKKQVPRSPSKPHPRDPVFGQRVK